MKPILKALTSPFRSSKNKKSKKQSTSEENQQNNNHVDNLQNNIDIQKVVNKDNDKFSEVYGQIEKMVDQLGNMLNFNEKMTETQKRQLIYELSSMAMNQKRMGNNLFDEDVLESQEEDERQTCTNQQHDNQQVNNKQGQNQEQINSKKSISDVLTSSNSLQKQQSSPSSSPEKQLKQLFEYFETEQNTGNIEKNGNGNENHITNNSFKQNSYSTFMDIRAQMSRFWSKNSSKVLKLMKHKKHQQKTIKMQSIKRKQNKEQQQQEPKLKKKKSSLVGSLFSSWNGKKQQKTLNSTAPTQTVDNTNVINVIDDDNSNQQQGNNQNYEQNVKQQTKIQFSIDDQ